VVGGMRLKCSGPVLGANVERFNKSNWSTGGTGPDPHDATIAIYELGEQTLSEGKDVTITVFSLSPVTVIAGTTEGRKIIFPTQRPGN
jgi:hypothetical protein